jgi:sulfonate transport system ATP-binding protein
MTLTTFANPTNANARTPQPVILRGVGRTFTTPSGPRRLLAGVDLELAAGEIVALIGPSGCGKSTLLRQVSGLDKPDTGEIRIDGRASRGIDHRCAVAFQEPHLLPWRTLSQNVAVGIPRGTPKGVGTRRVADGPAGHPRRRGSPLPRRPGRTRPAAHLGY